MEEELHYQERPPQRIPAQDKEEQKKRKALRSASIQNSENQGHIQQQKQGKETLFDGFKGQDLRLIPLEPLLLPSLRQDTAYACITSQALSHHRQEQSYFIPQGFVGLVIDQEDQRERTLLAGEKAEGNFILHLFRQGSLLLPLTRKVEHSLDGFELNAKLQFSLRLQTSDQASLKDFLKTFVQGSSHLSYPLLKYPFEALFTKMLQKHCANYSVADLLDDPQRGTFEGSVLEEIGQSFINKGFHFLGVDSLDITSPDYQKTLSQRARKQRELEEKRKKLEFETLIMREETGAELSRAELSEVLDSIQEKEHKLELQQKQRRLERESSLTKLEENYRKERYNLEAALGKMMAENELAIDRLKYEEYLRMTKQVREQLADDRIEFYIHQIKDESLKTELLKRLIERDMSVEQLRELTALERARSERLHSTPEIKTQAQPESTAPKTRDEITAANPQDKQTTPSQEDVQKTSSEHTPPPLPFNIEEPPEPEPTFQTEVQEVFQAQDLLSPEARPHHSTAEAAFESQTQDQVAKSEAVHENTPSSSFLELHKILILSGRKIYTSYLSQDGRASHINLYTDLDAFELGSLRSLQVQYDIQGKKKLFVGARRGLYVIQPETKEISSYPISFAFNPVTGINAALEHEGFYYATHSQFGLVRWAIHQPGHDAQSIFQEYTEHSQSSRSLSFSQSGSYHEKELLFSCGRNILLFQHHEQEPQIKALFQGASAEILSVSGLKERIYAVCEDGSILFWSHANPQQPELFFQMKAPLSAASLSSDHKHLILADRSPHLRTLNLESGVFARYDAPQNMRLGREFGNHLFGLSHNRSTVYLWDSFGNGSPITEVPLLDNSFDICGMAEA